MGRPLLEAGTYYLKISGPRASYFVKYTIDTREDEYGDIAENAYEIAGGQDYAGAVNYTGDVDCLRFTVPFKSECTITVVPNPDPVNLNIYVYDENEAAIAIQTLTKNNGYTANITKTLSARANKHSLYFSTRAIVLMHYIESGSDTFLKANSDGWDLRRMAMIFKAYSAY